jgi:AcrR family transcriptional regulator
MGERTASRAIMEAVLARPAAQRLRAPHRREQLLDVTCRLVVKGGFHGVSIEAVAQHAGVTRAAVYKHFRDLQDLFEAVVEREMARALAQVSEPTPEYLASRDPVDALIESLAAYLKAVQRQPATWRLVLMPPEGAPASLHRRIASGRAVILARLARAVGPALALDPEMPDAYLTARTFSATSDEYARLVLSDPERFSPERLLAHARWSSRRLLAPIPAREAPG